MNTSNTTLMKMSQETLRGKRALAIGTFLIYSLLVGAFSSTAKTGIISLIIAGPLNLGAAYFSLSMSRGDAARLEQLFDGFKYFSKALVTYLFRMLYVVLWTLLLIIPGIIAALSYSMSFYILADNPLLTPGEILDYSKKMMYGYKLQLFYLFLRFLLLAILCVLTLGIGFLWLIPYINVTMAKFYDYVKNNPMAMPV